MGEPVAEGQGAWHFPPPPPGALTRDEFIKLYDLSSEILHMRNPFSAKDPATHTLHPIPEWVRKVQLLLRIHRMRLVGSETLWVVKIPPVGPVQLLMGLPVP